MDLVKNIIINGAANRPMGIDIFFTDKQKKNPVVIYVHGFNGFKDWGNFDMVAGRFVTEGFTLVKFNFSHNGTTPEQPEIFADLDAFGNNNYTKQLLDLALLIDWVCDPLNLYHDAIDTHKICLVGHSMGGGIAIIKAAEDKRVNKLITWAAISECKTPWGSWPAEKMEEWKQKGVEYYINGRTGQHMPLYYQLYEDYCNNSARLNIEAAIKSLQIPVLICHGKEDAAVTIDKAYDLKRWQPNAQLCIVNSDHVFGRKHPWTEPGLPAAMEEVLAACFGFLKGK